MDATDETDLPDADYESIYGHAAMHARLLARLDALLRKMEIQAAEFRAWTVAREAQGRPEPPAAGQP